jgi:hypothetical protein
MSCTFLENVKIQEKSFGTQKNGSNITEQNLSKKLTAAKRNFFDYLDM